MYRRRHKKSRNGCLQCKRRHLKCDEQHPKCVTCAVANFSCSFETEINTQLDTRSPTVTSSTRTSESCSPDPLVISQDSAQLPGVADINSLHIELFFNFITNITNWFGRDNEEQIAFQKVLAPIAWENQFLLCELLALSACHLSEKKSDKASYYSHVASSYQVRALSGLNIALANINSASCKAVLFFSHFIAIHSFHDKFALTTNRSISFGNFVRQFVESMSLLRGVRTVVSPWWSALVSSEMGPIILASQIQRESALIRMGSETALLKDLVMCADVSDSCRDVYLCAIRQLQGELDYFLHVDENHSNAVDLVFTWLITASKEFLTLLEEQRPEALVILTYYGVILHKFRNAWHIGDSGKILVTSISEQLGQRWSTWLKWPRELIMTSVSVSSLA
ncbi:uncharacterized protein V1518DRAFT_397926 [Limtongia smithiae]|uniref:uncharacterized protein n=1 Tax=Limtongia smithiae TaxID=1125753 RepID=UPI0034CDD8FC